MVFRTVAAYRLVMKVHLVQMDIAWENKRANAATVEAMLGDANVAAGDLVVLPELFDTGFSFRVERTNDTQGETAAFLADLAQRLGVTVHGARTVMDEDGVHGLNRAHVVGPDGGMLATYDKIHPFTFGSESQYFLGGTAVTTYTWRSQTPATPTTEPERSENEPETGLTVCPAVCYDLRFPELFREGLDLGAEAFALGANWPAARQGHWRALAIARAIENQAFVFAVNRVGRDPALEYTGGSLVVGPRGDALAEGGREPEVVTAEVDPGEVRTWRGVFPALRDRSPVFRGRDHPA